MPNAMPLKGSQVQQQSIHSLAQVTDTLMQFVQQIFHCCHCRATLQYDYQIAIRYLLNFDGHVIIRFLKKASNVQIAHIHHDIKSIDHS